MIDSPSAYQQTILNFVQSGTDDGTTQYLYGLTRIGEDSTDWRYYHGDALGSVRALSDSAGELISGHAYSPYGDPTTESPDTFGYTGEQTGAGGLVFLRARYYDPGAGVFLSHDPWSGNVMRPASMNGWSYVEGNPVNWTDPSGLCASCYVFFFDGINFAGDIDGDGDGTNNLTTEWQRFLSKIETETSVTPIAIYGYGTGAHAYTASGHLADDILAAISTFPANAATVFQMAEGMSPIPANKAMEILRHLDIAVNVAKGGCTLPNNAVAQEPIKIDFIGYSGGGQVAYSTAQALQGKVFIDNVVLLGSPWQATVGLTNIGQIWELNGASDMLSQIGRLAGWPGYNNGWRHILNPNPLAENPIIRVLDPDLNIYSSGQVTPCSLGETEHPWQFPGNYGHINTYTDEWAPPIHVNFSPGDTPNPILGTNILCNRYVNGGTFESNYTYYNFSRTDALVDFLVNRIGIGRP